MGKRLFFSYGHDKNADFVRRLRCSLTAKGQQVRMGALAFAPIHPTTAR